MTIEILNARLTTLEAKLNERKTRLRAAEKIEKLVKEYEAANMTSEEVTIYWSGEVCMLRSMIETTKADINKVKKALKMASEIEALVNGESETEAQSEPEATNE